MNNENKNGSEKRMKIEKFEVKLEKYDCFLLSFFYLIP